MNKLKRVNEDKVQKWLENNYENIIDLIKNSEILEDKPNVYPSHFSLDYLVSQKMIDSSRYVYENLATLDLVIANKNISMNKQERLYPDLLLFNQETATFIIVEIKRSDKAEREAITELLAYEHELQNLFPFMSKIEVCFVLISADYKPLLEHSLSSLVLWQNRKVLPLKIDGLENNNENKWELSVYEADSWSLLSNGYVKANQIDTIHLVLYDKDAYSEGYVKKIKKNDLQIIKRGLELIIAEGEKNSASGFVLMLQATKSEIACWDIIIGVLRPYSFLELVEYESKIKDFFLKNYSDNSFHTKNTGELALNAQKYLSIYFNPKFEVMSRWDITRKEIEHNSYPYLIDFFGELDMLVNTFVVNKELRDYFYPELNTRNNFDWKNPTVGIDILDSLLGENTFFNGEFSYLTLYKFGKELGIVWQYTHIIQNIIDPDNNPYTDYFHGKYEWAKLSFLKSYREVFIRYKELKNSNNDFVIFESLKENIDENIENINKIIYWIVDNFLEYEIHKEAFLLGFQVKNYFYDRAFLFNDDEESIEKLIVIKTRELINLEFEQEEFVQNFLIDKVKEYKKVLGLDNFYDYSNVSKDKIIDVFETYTLPLYSNTVSGVPHDKILFSKDTIDIAHIKKVYLKEYEKNSQIAVNLASDGTFGIVNVPDEEKLSLLLVNPKKELMFRQTFFTGMVVLKKVTWEEFEDMEFF